jgi:hypothetical protein
MRSAQQLKTILAVAMENLKPDEVGVMGEEAIESVSLPRPEGASGCLLFLLLVPLYLYIFWAIETVEEWTLKQLQWPPQQAEALSLFLGLASLLGIYIVALSIRRYSPLKLHIEKGNQAFVAADEHFEIWSGSHLFVRAIPPFIWLLMGIWLIWVGEIATLRHYRFFGLLICSHALLFQVRPIFYPLLIADEKGVRLASRFVGWEQIQSIEVEHLTNLDGGFSAVRITVIGTDGRRRGRVSLAKENLSAVEEKDLLIFFARRLGRRVLPVAPNSPDWI